MRYENKNTKATATVDYRNKYGAVETQGLVDGAAYHDEVDYSQTFSLADISRFGGRITRVRLIGEYVPRVGKVVDVSYIHAVLPGGKIVPVRSGLDNLMPLWSVKTRMVNWAKDEGVFAKGLGLLDEGNWSVAV